ncbi:hypothetical protein GN956_G15596 [Arapaima gigas]
MESIPAVSVPRRFAQLYRDRLEALGVLNQRFRLQKRPDGTVALPVLPHCVPQLELLLRVPGGDSAACSLTYLQDAVLSKKASVKSSSETLAEALQELLESQGQRWSEELRLDVPHSWQCHGDLALLGEGCFSWHVWETLGPMLWLTVARELGVKRLARIGRVNSDGLRTPRVTMLLGEDSWVTHVDNGIRFEFDVIKCMFSSGNISEKLRIASFDCSGETVVDLYAGIGYFTLPYLVHSGAAHVHACEWNPHAVEALRRNLQLNRVSERCTVHQGDNRQVQLRDVADRVNLGLIPSSEEGWPVACRLLKQATGGVLHVHQNVSSPPRGTGSDSRSRESRQVTGAELGAEGEETRHSEREAWTNWAKGAAHSIAALLAENHGSPWTTKILHIECVKSYAPHIHHLVLDLECRPC